MRQESGGRREDPGPPRILSEQEDRILDPDGRPMNGVAERGGGAAAAVVRADTVAVVQRAMAGDPAALRTIWEENRRWVAAVILAHKPAFEDLDDLLQEVALTLVDKIDTLREAEHLRAWLRTVAVNTARAAGRRSKFRPRREVEDHDLTADAVPEAIVGSERSRRILDRVAALPETYREPLVMRAVRGMRSKQIAEILGIPPATVDTRIARARRMLTETEKAHDDARHESIRV